MKIDALRLFNVKRFEGRGVAIEGMTDGVNVLAAPNEFGKSTSFEALNALFFAKHSSRSADVTSLRSYSGGAPLVEADVTTSTGHYRITKQFLNKPVAQVVDLQTGRMIAQADEAEAFIGGLMGDAANGPAALLWIKQGVTGWERRTKAEDENETSARTDLLHSVQGEVEAITGGRRMADIQTATEAELKELITATGRPKAGGKYHEALAERDRLQVEFERLSLEVESLREALDRKAANTRRLKEINDPAEVEARNAAVIAAETKFEAAKSRQEILTRLKAELKLAEANRDTASRDLTQYQEALKNYAATEQELTELKPQLAEATQRRQAAIKADQQARENATEAERAENEARAALEKCDAASRAAEFAKRLVVLQDSLQRAQTARANIETLKAELSTKTVPTSALTQLEGLENTLLRLTTIRDAARPSVTVEYEDGASAQILMDGAPLLPSQEMHYVGRTTLSAPGIGTLQLRSNSVDNADELIACEEKHRALLASLGVASLAAARARNEQAAAVQGRIETETVRLDTLAPDGIEGLQQAIAACQVAIQDAPQTLMDRDVLAPALEAAQVARRDSIATQTACAASLSSAYNRYIEISTRYSPLESQLAQMATVLGAQEDRQALLERLMSALSRKQSAVDDATVKVSQAEGSATDFEFAQASLSRARSAKAAAETESNQLQIDNASLNALINARADDAVEENRNERREKLEAATARVATFENEVAILQRLQTALHDARQEAKTLYLSPVMDELRPLLSMLFEDVSINFNDQTLLPDIMVRKGVSEDVDNLSGGMREQLSILTRLAFARLLARDNRPIPVVLDDALIYSDDDRIEHMFNALHRQANDQQVIVLTCRQRAFQKLGGNVLNMVPWNG